jgi:hypothetical protein
VLLPEFGGTKLTFEDKVSVMLNKGVVLQLVQNE